MEELKAEKAEMRRKKTSRRGWSEMSWWRKLLVRTLEEKDEWVWPKESRALFALVIGRGQLVKGRD